MAEQLSSTTGEQVQETTRDRGQFAVPPVDIYAVENGIEVVADLPGVSSEGLDVNVKDEVLTIEGRAHHASTGEPLYREFEVVNYFRQFQLSERVDVPNITAHLQHGVLTLRLPRQEAPQPRKIEVAVG